MSISNFKLKHVPNHKIISTTVAKMLDKESEPDYSEIHYLYCDIISCCMASPLRRTLPTSRNWGSVGVYVSQCHIAIKISGIKTAENLLNSRLFFFNKYNFIVPITSELVSACHNSSGSFKSESAN